MTMLDTTPVEVIDPQQAALDAAAEDGRKIATKGAMNAESALGADGSLLKGETRLALAGAITAARAQVADAERAAHAVVKGHPVDAAQYLTALEARVKAREDQYTKARDAATDELLEACAPTIDEHVPSAKVALSAGLLRDALKMGAKPEALMVTDSTRLYQAKERVMAEKIGVFVSHHHSPKEDASTARLVADLEAAGADVCVDYQGIASGRFVQKINEGLSGRQWLVLVMTNAALRSTWVQAEVNAAIYQVNSGRMRGVISFVMTRCDEAQIPPLWATHVQRSREHTRSRLCPDSYLLITAGGGQGVWSKPCLRKRPGSPGLGARVERAAPS
jgi:hypothetical protein